MPSYDPVLGIAAPEIPWVPTPAHVMRRAVLLDILGSAPPGAVIEVGCGVGAFLLDLKERGFRGKGVDSSEHALAIARQFHGDDEAAFTIKPQISEEDEDSYEYLMAFEVLEHIDGDLAALSEWARCLRPGGTAIVSVPAHRRRWGASDQWAGHVRRYDFDDLQKLLTSAGFEVTDTRCYGFPLLNLVAPISNFMNARKIRARESAARNTDSAAATAKSGADRTMESRIFWLYSNILSKTAFRICFALQRLFYKSGLGTGFVFVARKRQQAPV